MRNIIEQKFPGITITEIEKAEQVTEADFTTEHGIAYESRISDSGEILTVEKEKD